MFQIVANPDELRALFLDVAKEVLASNSPAPVKPVEIIDRKTLISRLDISEPTAIRWQQKGKIPYLKIGSAIRYEWHSVVEALTVKGGR